MSKRALITDITGQDGSYLASFSHAGLDWQRHVKIDPRFIRPAAVSQ